MFTWTVLKLLRLECMYELRRKKGKIGGKPINWGCRSINWPILHFLGAGQFRFFAASVNSGQLIARLLRIKLANLLRASVDKQVLRRKGFGNLPGGSDQLIGCTRSVSALLLLLIRRCSFNYWLFICSFRIRWHFSSTS